MDEVRYLKRKIRSGNLDVHPTEKALVVNYDVEALILGELGDPMLGDRKECQKIIRLKSLNADTNVTLLAREIIDKCSLIHESKLHEVEQLIYYLQNRKSSGGDFENAGQPPRPMSSTSLNVDSGDIERAIISNIDDYIELLYEDISDKIKGSSSILKLTRIPDNLQELSKNETLLSVLARVLREDWKKSIELSINIIYIFFCFATYSQFHNIVVDYRIGSLCMDIIDYELIRFDQWKDDLEKRRRYFENNTGMCLLPTMSTENSDKKTKLMDNLWNSNSSLDLQINRQPIDGAFTVGKDDIDKLKDDLEKHHKKFKCLMEKQEQLLKVCFYLLLNIAENKEVEKKMRKKNVIGMLLKTLDRTNTDLLILVVTFLKKLSIYRENKDVMAEGNIIEKLPKLLHITNSDLVSMTLRLLFNLSFDTKLRGKMIRVGLLPKLVKLLIQDDVNRSTILGILYHASIDDKVKMMFINTECISLVTNMLLESDDEQIFPELVALCINLATNNKNAELMIENNRLKSLIKKAFKNQNALLMKIVRNISQNESTKEHFIEFVGDFAMALTQSNCQDFVLEIIGVMGNLALTDLDYSQILQRCNLIPWIRNSLIPGKAQDDLVLEVVIFLGTAAASDEDSAQVMCKADILLSLIELLKAKQEDDEIVLQIIYVFYQISKHDSTREYLIRETGNEAPGYLIDLMHDKNPAIRKICDACLDVIALCDKDWAARIKVEKFRSHNQQWLDMVESINGDISATSFSAPDEDDNFTPFASRDLLKHTMLFPSGNNTRFNIDDGDLVTKTLSDSSENLSRPNSRYSRDLNEICEMVTTSKSQLSMSSG
ncbi:PREDICTED: kinesin-associated protein 3 [Ceratosolen solmsi marchali]|uniref:Kinesin-associated protein 3 n=1 Tax=Ceratosolen solmsi marchali TaxID=326594 RepID=A0AAJ6YN16_9HYME|nr:PREDICTED: kinesin-associated protein 3 [Ceratosolen solmsi marchali]XP_011501081.1 PREDICTED: kinesin-associated protein 3 [Ceratosolen solmsi marchali]